MALTKFLATFIGVALAAGTLSGCEGGFSLFGGGEEAPVEEPTPKPRRAKKPKPAADETAAAETSPSPKPSGAPANPRAFLYRNVAYDKVRNRAMQQVYEGQTKKAMTTFQSAQRLRPDDPAVEMWMSAIRQSVKTSTNGAPTAVDDFRAATQQLRSPVAPGAPAAPEVVVPGGAAPTLPRPRAVPSPVQVDPGQVF